MERLGVMLETHISRQTGPHVDTTHENRQPGTPFCSREVRVQDSDLKDVIASAKQGDEGAFAELTRRAMMQRSASSPADAANAHITEALSDAIRAARGVGQQPTSRWFRWLLEIVGRLRPGPVVSESDDTRSLGSGPPDHSLSDSSQLLTSGAVDPPGPSDAVLPLPLARHIHQCLMALPDHDRAILELRYWMGCPLSDLARRLDCTESEAARKLRLALASFRREIVREEDARDNSE